MQPWWRELAGRCRGRMLAPLYRFYEHRLLRQVRASPVPRHIGLILDGNRRFGRRYNLSHPDDIYMAGANKLDDLLDWCIELDIPAITLWVFSTQNGKRPPEEVTGILIAIERKLKSLAADREFHSRRIRVRAVGRLELLPSTTLGALRAAEAATEDYSGMHLTIAAAYGGREEIVDAVRGFLRKELAHDRTLREAIELVTPEAIGRSLYAPDLPDPDLIIRTAGERRVSNFLLWQGAYAEMLVSETLWPDFGVDDLKAALADYASRVRRFGARPEDEKVARGAG